MFRFRKVCSVNLKIKKFLPTLEYSNFQEFLGIILTQIQNNLK